MTPERIAELRELCDRATPGPWRDHNWDAMDTPHTVADCLLGKDGHCHGQADMPKTFADAAFIAAARTALPEALAEVTRLRGMIAYSADAGSLAAAKIICNDALNGVSGADNYQQVRSEVERYYAALQRIAEHDMPAHPGHEHCDCAEIIARKALGIQPRKVEVSEPVSPVLSAMLRGGN